MSLQRVHLRVNDAATGRPTAVRLRVTDAAGNYYAPFGRAAEFAHGTGEDVGGNLLVRRDRWTNIDGTCEIALPPGDLTVEARKGPEYRPLSESVHLPAGKLALRLTIERWTDLRADGWYSGDTRAHELTPHAALLEAAAEDLAVVNLLARETMIAGLDGQMYQSFPNLLAFSGQQPCLERDGHAVVVNTHNTHPVLGRLGLLHCHRVVYPLTFGGADATDDWSLDDWCGQCHRKRGLVVWTDAFAPRVGHTGEALADLILGHVDALELDPASPYRLQAWYQLLRAGVRVPVVGASAKESNRTPVGALRTYARCPVGESFTYTGWIDAVRNGRTFVTAGPIAMLQVEGEGPGAEVRHADGALSVRFGVRAAEPFERVDVLANGSVVASGDGADREVEVALPRGGWVAVRCLGHGRMLAHTSPVYVRIGDSPPPVDAAAVAGLDRNLLLAREWVESEGRFSNLKSRDRLLAIFDAARLVLADRPNGPASPR